jgi:hypothetical protein
MLKSIGPQFIARGVRVSQQAPWISHLLFVDGCLIFTQASRRRADRISEILELYYKGSGQLVNKNKSAIFFSGNYVLSAKQEVHKALQIPTETLGEKYMGLPTAVGNVSDDTFDYVADRIRNFIHDGGGIASKLRWP